MVSVQRSFPEPAGSFSDLRHGGGSTLSVAVAHGGDDGDVTIPARTGSYYGGGSYVGPRPRDFGPGYGGPSPPPPPHHGPPPRHGGGGAPSFDRSSNVHTLIVTGEVGNSLPSFFLLGATCELEYN